VCFFFLSLPSTTMLMFKCWWCCASNCFTPVLITIFSHNSLRTCIGSFPHSGRRRNFARSERRNGERVGKKQLMIRFHWQLHIMKWWKFSSEGTLPVLFVAGDAYIIMICMWAIPRRNSEFWAKTSLLLHATCCMLHLACNYSWIFENSFVNRKFVW
jgi:hypothetical protein